jgi:hypothetical protein
MLKIQVECKHSFGESFYRFPVHVLDLQQKEVHHWKEHEISV